MIPKNSGKLNRKKKPEGFFLVCCGIVRYGLVRCGDENSNLFGCAAAFPIVKCRHDRFVGFLRDIGELVESAE